MVDVPTFLRKYFHCQTWLTRYAMGARLTILIHVKWCHVGPWYHIIRSYHDLQDVSFNLTVLHGCIMVVTWFSDGQPPYDTMVDTDTNMVNHVSTLFTAAG